MLTPPAGCGMGCEGPVRRVTWVPCESAHGATLAPPLVHGRPEAWCGHPGALLLRGWRRIGPAVTTGRLLTREGGLRPPVPAFSRHCHPTGPRVESALWVALWSLSSARGRASAPGRMTPRWSRRSIHASSDGPENAPGARCGVGGRACVAGDAPRCAAEVLQPTVNTSRAAAGHDTKGSTARPQNRASGRFRC